MLPLLVNSRLDDGVDGAAVEVYATGDIADTRMAGQAIDVRDVDIPQAGFKMAHISLGGVFVHGALVIGATEVDAGAELLA